MKRHLLRKIKEVSLHRNKGLTKHVSARKQPQPIIAEGRLKGKATAAIEKKRFGLLETNFQKAISSSNLVSIHQRLIQNQEKVTPEVIQYHRMEAFRYIRKLYSYEKHIHHYEKSGKFAEQKKDKLQQNNKLYQRHLHSACELYQNDKEELEKWERHYSRLIANCQNEIAEMQLEIENAGLQIQLIENKIQLFYTQLLDRCESNPIFTEILRFVANEQIMKEAKQIEHYEQRIQRLEGKMEQQNDSNNLLRERAIARYVNRIHESEIATQLSQICIEISLEVEAPASV